MGCDIHGYIEVKLVNRFGGVWITYSRLSLSRDYGLFNQIADCGRGPGPGWPNRGLPHDAAPLTKLESAYEQGHSHTVLTLEEMGRVEKWYEEKRERFTHPAQPWGYLFGNGWNREALIPGVSDARAVIWFDN